MHKKRLRALIISLIMAIALLAQPAVAFAASSTVITISSDKTEVEPGDVITFAITIGPVKDMGTMQMEFVIPEGLTLISGTAKFTDGLKKTLGYDDLDFKNPFGVVGFASEADYSSDSDTPICTFQCKVEDGFSGTAEIDLRELEFYSCQTWEDHTKDYSVVKAVVRSAAQEEPDPGQPEDPAQPPEDPVTPGGTDEPSEQPSEDPNKDQPEDPDKPSDEPDQGEDPEPSGKTPSGETPSEETPSRETPSGNTTPDSGKKDPDPGKNDKNKGQNDPGDKDHDDSSKQGSEGKTEPSEGQKEPSEGQTEPTETTPADQPSNEKTQRAFPWWAVAAAAVVIAAVVLFITKRQKRK